MLKEVFGSHKPVIAMAHFPPLPGTSLYDANKGMDGIVDYVTRDLKSLQDGGVDCIMFGNEGDRPYLLSASPESLSAMAAAVGVLKSELRVPFGVDYLWDAVATVALGVATGAGFVREIFTGVYDSDMGLWQPNAARAVRMRHDLGRDDMKLLFNVNAEFASPLGGRPIEARAKSAVFSSLADVVLVSGPMTGQAVDRSDLRRVKESVGDTPVFANTGVTRENVTETLAVADGVVIGTHLKVDGHTWNPVDSERVKRFMETVGKTR